MKNTRNLQNITILVPAHNEELVLASTLKSALKLVKSSDLFVIDDNSTDSTFNIAYKYTKNVLKITDQIGKANALNRGIEYFKLSKKYQYIFPLDADTRVSEDFLKKSLNVLDEDKTQKYICVVGKVIGGFNNWLTSYRMWEYEVTQLIHKNAQEKIGAVIVCPGCSTIYRAKLFINHQFPTDTVTEDMDLTFYINRQNLGSIKLIKGASVVTQDPFTLRDYLKQIRRWYRGYWQCLKKYNVPFGFQTLDLELTISTIEGLTSGFLVLIIVSLLPFILFKQWNFLLIPFLIDFFLFFLPTIYLTMFIHSNFKILKYLPFFYFLRGFNSLVFLYSFFESLLAVKKIMIWDPAQRYQLKGAI